MAAGSEVVLGNFRQRFSRADDVQEVGLDLLTCLNRRVLQGGQILAEGSQRSFRYARSSLLRGGRPGVVVWLGGSNGGRGVVVWSLAGEQLAVRSFESRLSAEILAGREPDHGPQQCDHSHHHSNLKVLLHRAPEIRLPADL